MDSAAYIKVFLSPAADVELETADSSDAPEPEGPPGICAPCWLCCPQPLQLQQLNTKISCKAWLKCSAHAVLQWLASLWHASLMHALTP